MFALKWFTIFTFFLLIGLTFAQPSEDDEDFGESSDEPEYDEDGNENLRAEDEKRFVSMSGFRERTNGKNPFFKWFLKNEAKPKKMRRNSKKSGIQEKSKFGSEEKRGTNLGQLALRLGKRSAKK